MNAYKKDTLFFKQDCTQMITTLQETIDRIEDICDMPDTDKAITAFVELLAGLMTDCGFILTDRQVVLTKKGD